MFIVAIKHARYHPSKGYWWDFTEEKAKNEKGMYFSAVISQTCSFLVYFKKTENNNEFGILRVKFYLVNLLYNFGCLAFCLYSTVLMFERLLFAVH